MKPHFLLLTFATLGAASAVFAQNAAPDGDRDGVPDALDRCPALAGPASNGGCPVENAAKPAPPTAPVPVEKPAPPKEIVRRAPHDPFFDKPLDAAEIKRQLDAMKPGDANDPALKAEREAPLGGAERLNRFESDANGSALQKLARTLRPNGASLDWIDEASGQPVLLRFRVALTGEPLVGGGPSVFRTSLGEVMAGNLAVAQGAVPASLCAPPSVAAHEIIRLNLALEAAPDDGVSLSARAAQWAKIGPLFKQSRQPRSKAIYLADKREWFKRMNADIEMATAKAPRDPKVWANVALAWELARVRELSDNQVAAALSPETATRLQTNLAALDERIEGAHRNCVVLGDARPRAWWLFKQVAQSSDEKRPLLLGELGAVVKRAPDDAFVALCYGAALSVFAPRPEVRAAMAPQFAAKIEALAKTKPQETHDALSHIARVVKSQAKDDDARRFQERAAAIAGVKIHPENRLVAYKLNPNRTDAQLASFIADVEPDFETTGSASEKFALMEGLAARLAAKGDWRGAFETRANAALAGAKAVNWVEAGDMAAKIGDWKHAAIYWEVFEMMEGTFVADFPIGLEVNFARHMAGRNAFESESYDREVRTYPNRVLVAHGQLVDAQLALNKAAQPKGVFVPARYAQVEFEAVSEAIAKKLAEGEAGDKSVFTMSGLVTRETSNDIENFRLYAPTRTFAR